MFKRITDDLDALLERLPPRIAETLREQKGRSDLLEVVMDLGRLPEARFPDHEITLSDREVTADDIEYLVSRIASFGGDNRAGIARTLHRISAIRNRKGNIVGLTCRVGRAVYGTIGLIADLVESGKSILLMGGPGVGKTTMLREMARVLADELKKRVVIVDTSNEIAGDGDIPHPGIGRARRMQVTLPQFQHDVMIEAVENHMPEVIVIDEIGTELEALAARTIAERGVQLIATAHGNTLENLIMNPTLSDLIGGIQTVTLSDEEAKRRGTQKSILERKAPPTFDIVIEIQDWYHVAVHSNVTEVVDAMLRGRPIPPELRWIDENDAVKKEQAAPPKKSRAKKPLSSTTSKIYPFGINRIRLEQAMANLNLSAKLTSDLREANVLMTSKSYYRKKAQLIRDAENASIPIYVIRSNKVSQMERSLASIFNLQMPDDPLSFAMKEAEEAVAQVSQGKPAMELRPQNSYLRMLQHQLVERYGMKSQSIGREPHRRVQIFHNKE